MGLSPSSRRSASTTLEFLGDTHESVAAEKAGIIKADAAVVVGYVDDGPRRVIADAAKAVGAAEVVHAGDDFAVTSDRVALGGRLVSIRTPHTTLRRDLSSVARRPPVRKPGMRARCH